MHTTARERKVERIRKLLEHSLGHGTTNDEADTVRLLARKLMATHRVSFDEVTRNGQTLGQENGTEADAPTARPQAWHASASEQRSDRRPGDNSSHHSQAASDTSSPHTEQSEAAKTSGGGMRPLTSSATMILFCIVYPFWIALMVPELISGGS